MVKLVVMTSKVAELPSKFPLQRLEIPLHTEVLAQIVLFVAYIFATYFDFKICLNKRNKLKAIQILRLKQCLYKLLQLW